MLATYFSKALLPNFRPENTLVYDYPSATRSASYLRPM